MSKSKKTVIQVPGGSVAVHSENQQDIFCLTDIAKFKNPDHPDDVIRNWLRSRNTVEFLGVWERLNNPSFNPVKFDGIRMQPRSQNPGCPSEALANEEHLFLKPPCRTNLLPLSSRHPITWSDDHDFTG